MAGQLAVLCGQVLVVGLSSTELSTEERRWLEDGLRGGVVLFRRNVPGERQGPDGPRGVLALSRSVHSASTSNTQDDRPPPLIAIDQEGGRVVRIGPPALALPPMRRVGDLDDVRFTERLAWAQARELAAMGITMSFAPIADIHTRPENPIIGDRAFASTADAVAKQAVAWAAGLMQGGVLSCAKHFPGHGDTTVDSHLELPRVERSRGELQATEIASFRAIARDPDIASMMTAHVVYPALDAERPATLSRAICTDLLRGELRFTGVLFSDDLEMKAIKLPVSEAAVLAVSAGCDSLLVCSRADLADEAHAALVHEAEKSPAFRTRIEQANRRFIAMRKKHPLAMASSDEELDSVFAKSEEIASELATRLADHDNAEAEAEEEVIAR